MYLGLSLCTGLAVAGCAPEREAPAGASTLASAEPRPPSPPPAAPPLPGAPASSARRAPLGPVFLSPRDGLVWSLFGDEITRKVTGDETGGAYAIVESRVDPGGGPPPHVHHGEEELFYVSEGEFELRWGSELRRGGPGTIALLPRDVPHGFRNVGKTPGRLVTVISPAGFEGFFEEVFALPPADRNDMAKVSAVGAKYRVEFLPLPPPGGAAAPATSAK